jgi:hypothetical protein
VVDANSLCRFRQSQTKPGVFYCSLCYEPGDPEVERVCKEWLAISGPNGRAAQSKKNFKTKATFPSLLRTARQRRKSEKAVWEKAGRPLRSPERIAQIHDELCKPCDYYSTHLGFNTCQLCGCGLRKKGAMMNKIAWATTSCPDKPPKWTAEVEVASKIEPEVNRSLWDDVL